jgi:probable HAF family extracellular repeat protein
MRRFCVRSGGLAALLGCASATAVTPPLPSYGITPIPVPASAASLSATAINGSGQVTGAIEFNGGVPSQAFLYSDGSVSDLGSLNYPGTQLVGNTSGQAINAAGVVVGTFVDPVSQSWSFGFEYAGGTLTVLFAASGFTNCTATGINAAGLVVGSCANLTTSEAVTYSSSGAPQQIGPAGATASAVNDYGQVAGFTAAGGFVYNDQSGATATIPALTSSAAAEPANPTAINNAGQVVGWQAEGTSYAAFLYSNGTTVLLADVPLSTVQPTLAINNAGQVVGYSQAAGSTAATAFYIANGTLTDIDTLISRSDPNQPYVTFTNAYAINDSGWIVAAGRDSRTGLSSAYLLTPRTAFPASVTVMAAATATTGTPFTVGWTDQSVTACTASGGSGKDGWKGSSVTINGGQLQLTETTAGTYQFTLSCSGTSGSVSSTAKVVVSNMSMSGLDGGGGSGTQDLGTLAALVALCALRVLSSRRAATV